MNDSAEFYHVFIESVLADGFVLDDGTAIIDGLRREEQQASDVGCILDTQADEGKRAQLGGQRVRRFLLDPPVFLQQCVELIDKRWIQFQESLVEAGEEGGSIFFRDAGG